MFSPNPCVLSEKQTKKYLHFAHKNEVVCHSKGVSLEEPCFVQGIKTLLFFSIKN